MFKTIFVLALTLFVSGIAEANWSRTAAGTTNDCSFSRWRKFCYFNNSATADSAMIATAACESVAFKLTADTTVDASGGGVAGAEVFIWGCSTSTVSVNTCDREFNDAGNVTLNGDPTVGRAATYGHVGSYFYVENDSNAGSDSYRVVAICSRGN